MSEKPHRALTLYAQIGADTPQDMMHALEKLIRDVEAGDMPPERVSGGVTWGGTFAWLTDADMTHAAWEAILKAWLAERAEEKAGR